MYSLLRDFCAKSDKSRVAALQSLAPKICVLFPIEVTLAFKEENIVLMTVSFKFG